METISITNTHIIMILFYFLIIYLFRLYLNLPDGRTTSPFYPPLSSPVSGWLLCLSSLCVSSLIGGLLFQQYRLTSDGRTTSLFHRYRCQNDRSPPPRWPPHLSLLSSNVTACIWLVVVCVLVDWRPSSSNGGRLA